MPRHVAVLGAGLTGLSSAFHLSRLHPNLKVTLIEGQKQAGGWVRSSRIALPDNYGSVLLEAGPRTLRPNAQSILELVNILKLQDRVITVSKDSPAAKARYLYIPPEYGGTAQGLQEIPSSLFGLLKSPLTRTLVPAVVQELFKWNNAPPDNQDESVDSFLRRRFGSSFAETFGSAIIHGIYAADSRKVSIGAAFPTMVDAANRGWGGLVRGMLVPSRKQDPGSYDVGDMPNRLEGAAVFSFRDGMQTLTDSLEEDLKRNSNVEIIYNSPASSLEHGRDEFQINLAGGQTIPATHVISTVPTPTLHHLLASSNGDSLQALIASPTSTVHVVNIVFPGPPSSIHPAGFGYLIPRPPSGYPANPSTSRPGFLGTVFDSCSLADQDTETPNPFSYDNARFTKLTVMVGGPYPTPSLPPFLSSSEGPTSPAERQLPDYMRTVLDQLSLHLSQTLPDPVYWRVVPNRRCIPTLLPGHTQRIQELRSFLDTRYEGRLQIAGAGVGGVSLGDCVEGGRKAARNLVL
ncbi:protoporphyrinogen oxidase [Coprinopsis marcescibilis]|uniref:Protoporphyrinogen oxidase n=1 Tax=Coprinopsis marcescibilis TaxID=230819 RepID=A0A5C3LGA3_COPMA|nr:protoporphyrinogen oxidase [Coprinopsis marcescibilis]